ncbi:MAG: YqeG family HAD IIIA-type phosphatase [Candidatus Caenarcaniphilales bacterium]|nr:YqeG family HAD IIIA-type phosphatase [Candidatus Caenarcaniphilales bacterium]
MFPLKPTYYIDGTVEEIDLKLLSKDGIRGLILDLDNTIMRPRSGYFCDKVLPWLKEAKSLGLKIIIVTNNINDEYLRKIAPVLQENDLPIISKAKKPRKTKLKEALNQLALEPEAVCIVGDRVLTDVLGGYLLNMKTAFVKPLLGAEENPLFRILRAVEESLLQKY